ncbi:hypothetical protein E0H26_17895 [Micromonospora zingiberis]|uniref:Uncharacterized protein n=1 Tax=Micromonospora zingiberis TaxID=2053011 RepID=A0A4R0GG55_9ACTN|nr:hypothetical protein E0H26_17895 [Micromonospora zingiberis]
MRVKWFQRPTEPVDTVGAATRYARQDGQPRPAWDGPTMLLPTRPLMTRAGWWRSSFAMGRLNQRRYGSRPGGNQKPHRGAS